MSPSSLPSSSLSQPAPIVAYLGPPGTYSHQAVLDRFGPQAAYRPCRTISDVFNYEPPLEAERAQGWHAALPFENSKNGIVLETLDLLLALAARAAKGKGRAAWAVEEELRVAVRHCLVVRECFDGELGELEWVRSHEQALAQCQTFLSHALPAARRVPMASTAGAAQSLLEPGNERGAAICARAVVDVVAGLKVVKEGVEDMSGNTTRFLLLRHPASPSSSSSGASPSPAVAPASSTSLHLYTYRPSPSDYPTFDPPRALASAAAAAAPKLRAVDRRPTGDGGSAYLVCFETASGGERPGLQVQDEVLADQEEWMWVGSWPAFGGARRGAARGSAANGSA